ncbi:MAG TPA: V4R domain-containing protein [Candidatus Bathyarchaeia archaeon]
MKILADSQSRRILSLACEGDASFALSEEEPSNLFSRTGLGDGLTFTDSYTQGTNLASATGNRAPSGGTVNTPNNSEVAESIKLTMKALKEYLGLRSASEKEKLQFIGAELGRIVSRNIPTSESIEGVLDEISGFWNSNSLGEMEVVRGTPLTCTIRNCYDCIAAQAGETLCGFKEGFINAILQEKVAGQGAVEEIECCGTGASSCKFAVTQLG